MNSILLRAVIALLLPVAVFFIGVYLMSRVSGRQYVTERLMQLPDGSDRKPLNQRLDGYDVAAVARHWSAFDPKARRCEALFLEMDLVFALCYGASFVASLLLVWAGLGRPFSPTWLMAPVAITLAADWIENLVQIEQLRLYATNGAVALEPGWIRVASVATTSKLIFFVGTGLLVIALTGWLAFKGAPRS